MKNRSWIIIAIFLLIMAIAIILTIIIEAHREKNVNHFIFPDSIKIANHTAQKRADTVAMIIANRIFRFDTIKIGIVYLQREFIDGETEFIGFVQKNPFKPHEYLIYLKKGLLPIPINKILSHEMIHIEQMETGDLIPIPLQPKMVYKGDTIVFADVPYDKRPFEIDAYMRETGIKKSLNQLLYKK
jgi:hypothetical protein